MPQLRAWSEYKDWSELFDSICIDQGHLDNAGLASEFCRLTGAKGEAAYETAARNLANWRRGQHIPHRRNFVVLNTLLNVEQYEELTPHWNRLYGSGRKSNGTTEESSTGSISEATEQANGHIPADHSAPTQISPLHPPRNINWTRWLTVPAVLAVGGLIFFLGSEFGRSDVAPEEVATIRDKVYVSPKIGESVVIHGVRGDCGKAPPPWDQLAPGFPRLMTGDLSAGRLGVRFSRACGGNTPAREVVFTARKAGKEQIMLFGANTIIDVKSDTKTVKSTPTPDLVVIRQKVYVTPNIGESVVIHGIRGDCGQPPPKWDEVAPGLPKPITGDLSAGKMGVRFSRSCGGATPARELVFTARRPGKEQITVFGDATTIEVK